MTPENKPVQGWFWESARQHHIEAFADKIHARLRGEAIEVSFEDGKATCSKCGLMVEAWSSSLPGRKLALERLKRRCSRSHRRAYFNRDVEIAEAMKLVEEGR